MLPTLADVQSATVDDFAQSYRSLVVSGLILVGLIVVSIWWLKKQA